MRLESTQKPSKSGAGKTKSSILELPVDTDEFHTLNFNDSREKHHEEAIKLPSTGAFQDTLKNKTATSTDNSNRSPNTHTTTGGVLKTNTPT